MSGGSRRNKTTPGAAARAVRRVAGPGDCYPAAEVVYHAAGGKKSGLTPAQVEHEGQSHWFVRSEDGKIYDPTASQFDTPVPYEEGVGRGFLTKKPSRRGKAMAREAGMRLNAPAKRLGAAIRRLAPEAAESVIRGQGSDLQVKDLQKDFKDGGCYILARALARWAGPSAKVCGIWVSDSGVDTLDHVVLKIGDWIFDQDGASTELAIVERWVVRRWGLKKNDLIVRHDGRVCATVMFLDWETNDLRDRLVCAQLRPVAPHDLRQIPRSPRLVRELEKIIRDELGDPSGWGIDTWGGL